MVEVECCMCNDKLRKDKALMDAKWEEYSIRKKMKYLCRDCAKLIARSVINDY